MRRCTPWHAVIQHASAHFDLDILVILVLVPQPVLALALLQLAQSSRLLRRLPIRLRHTQLLGIPLYCVLRESPVYALLLLTDAKYALPFMITM